MLRGQELGTGSRTRGGLNPGSAAPLNLSVSWFFPAFSTLLD